ncbi:MAG: HD domain-containing protein [Candidatus Paceibacterota bacterium]|jgi:poly(A) polymerase/tRNA nucleotidyltransferase (CCA-adding enzyme)
MQIPLEVLEILEKIKKRNFEAYLVGGCARDLLLDKEPKDWDITTQATPVEIQKIFPDSIYENNFGTVAIKTSSQKESLKIIEITTFRKEGKYTDKRHPDEIKFAQTIEEDLSRRDFTINAMALKIQNSKIKNQNCNSKLKILDTKYALIDPFGGQKDLQNKIIRTVGSPNDRFTEDALRLIRAIRFACELNFKIEKETLEAIKNNVGLIKLISQERIRDEFIKIIAGPRAAQGLSLMQETNLLKQIIPELEQGIGVTQNKHHIYTVWEHLLRSLDYAAKKNYSLEVKLASLFHDIGKPKTKRGKGINATFYNHEIEGTKMVSRILNRLKFPKDQSEKIIKLVRYHGFVYDPEITTDASIRRLLLKIGKENIEELAQVREADRIGSGCPKARPFRLRHFLFKVEKVLKETEGQQPSLKMLKVNGNDIMKILKIEAGPKIGAILNILLEKVLDDPEENKKEILEKEIKNLGNLSLKELKEKSRRAKEKYLSLLENEEKKIKDKYFV